MNLIDPRLDKYIEDHTQEEPSALKDLNRKTHIEVMNPRMIAGHYQGRALSMFSHMVKPTYILEIGTFTGYSAICWAEGLQDNGELHTIDINEEISDIARNYAIKSGIKNKISFHLGNALDIIPTIIREWDIVYIDADKANYIAYYNAVFDMVKPGGYIITDNVLWNGKVIDSNSADDENTRSIINFNNYIQSDKRVENILFPIRDGIMIARKL